MKKRLLSLLLAGAMLLGLIPGEALAADVIASGTCGEALTWSLDSDGLLSIDGSGDMPDWASASETPWASYADSVTQVKTGTSVASIGANAFAGFPALKKVSISFGVTRIGACAFRGCAALSDCYIPFYVTEIGASAFENCVSLRSANIPDSAVTLGDGAFRGCTGLQYVYIDSDCAAESAGCFRDCTEILRVSVGEGVTTIGPDVFRGCTKLWDMKLPQTFKTFCDGALAGCTSLEKLTIPQYVTTIGDALEGCTGLTDVTYGGTAKQWQAIAIGEASRAALSQAAIHTVEPDADAEVKGTGAFGDLTWTAYQNGLLYISGEGDMPDIETISDVPWFGTLSNPKTVLLGDGVRSVGAYVFGSRSGLTNIVFGSGVASIGAYAFYNNDSLACVEIPGSVRTIGESAFSGDTALKRLYIGSEEIGKQAFFNCKQLADVTLAEGVRSTGSAAFQRCAALTHIELPDSFTELGDHTFNECTNLVSVIPGSGLRRIGGSAFYKCKSLQGFDFPAGLKEIGDSAFSHVDAFPELDLPDGLEIIGNYAFVGQTKLTELVIPDSVTTLGKAAFSGCSALKTVRLSEGLTAVGANAFSSCTKLEELTVPAGVTSFGDYALSGCSKLTDVYYGGTEAEWSLVDRGNYDNIQIFDKATIHCAVPDDVGEVPDSAIHWQLANGVLTIYGEGAMADFSESEPAPWQTHWEEIKKAVIRDGVTNVGAYAFAGCNALTEVCLAASVAELGENVFDGCKVLERVEADPGSSVYSSVDGVLFDQEQQTLLLYPAGRIGRYTVPDTVTEIADDAFAGCSFLSGISLPLSLGTVGNGAFEGCTALAEVRYAGSEEGWQTVFIGSDNECLTKNKIRYGVLPHHMCGEDLSWTLENGVLTIAGTGPMLDWTDAAETPWGDSLAEIREIVIGDGVTTIGAHAFADCTGLQQMTVPVSLVSVGSGAFWGCHGLARVDYDGYRALWEQIEVADGNGYWKQVNVRCERCGENLYWRVKNGVLTISGTGAMEDFETAKLAPWHTLSEGIYAVELARGVTHIGTCAFQETKKLAIVRFEGAESEWKAVEIDLGNDNLKKAFVYCGGEGAALMDQTFGFPNDEYAINQEICVTTLGPLLGSIAEIGELIGNEGHCFGMALAVGVERYYGMHDFRNDAGEHAGKLSDVDDRDAWYFEEAATKNHVTAAEYESYAQMFQTTPEVVLEKLETKNDLDGLVEAVHRSLTGEGEPVIINIQEKVFSSAVGKHITIRHSVLAVDMQETDTAVKILVYDSTPHLDDCRNMLWTMRIMKDSGKYVSWNYPIMGFDSNHQENEKISYCRPVAQFHEWFPKRFVTLFGSLSSPLTGILGVPGGMTLEGYKDLLLIELSDDGEESDEVEDEMQFFWVTDQPELTLTASEDGGTIFYANTDCGVSAEVRAGATVTLRPDAGDGAIRVEDAGDDFAVSFYTLDGDDTVVKTTVSGTDSETVSASLSASGVIVTADNMDTLTARLEIDGEETSVYSFTGSEDSVLLVREEEKLTVLEDRDGDGSYEAEAPRQPMSVRLEDDVLVAEITDAGAAGEGTLLAALYDEAGRLLSTVTGTADVGPDRTSTVSMALPPLPADAVWLKIYLMDGLNAPVCPAIRLTAK